jgi:hypothetical protein
VNTSLKPRAIFISHSNQDKDLVQALTELLKTAFRLPAREILCTSVAGHKLAGGADTEDELLTLLRDARLLIGLLTPASQSSSYVLFELGARWGLKKPLISLVACGTSMGEIKEPLKSKNALNASDQDDVHQLIEDVAGYLNVEREPASAYNSKVRQLVSAAKIRKVAPTAKLSHSSVPVRIPQLLWPKLIDKITIKDEGPKGGCELIYSLAKRHGLKPFDKERYRGAEWFHTTFVGGSLSENSDLDRLFGESQTDEPNPKHVYEFSLTGELLEKTAPVVDAWIKKMPNSLPAKLQVHLVHDVKLEPILHRITSNIFGSELEMIGERTFLFRQKVTFSLWCDRGYGGAIQFEMNVYRRQRIKEIPWEDLFNQLVKHHILIVEKPLSKEIWL